MRILKIKKIIILTIVSMLIGINFNGQVGFAQEIKVTEGFVNTELVGLDLAAASVLNDGRVFITGGRQNDRSIKSTFIYDPVADIWTKGHDLPIDMDRHTQITLPDGRVLILGIVREGYDWLNTFSDVYIIDPITGEFEKKADLPLPLYGPGIVSKGDKLYVIGGAYSTQSLIRARSTVYEYDLTKDVWTTRNDLSKFLYVGHNARLKNGKVLTVTIGQSHIIGWDNSYEKGPELPEVLQNSFLTQLENGDILYIGGLEKRRAYRRYDYFANKKIYKYNEEKNIWEDYATLPFQPYFEECTRQLVYKNKIILFDGTKWSGSSRQLTKESDINHVITIAPVFLPEITVENADQVKIYKNNETIVIKGSVNDLDNDTVTISATLGGITKTTTVVNTATTKEWQLSWGTNEIPQGVYENVLFTAVN